MVVKEYFENELLSDMGIYKNFHSLIVVNSKGNYRKKPVCGPAIRGL
jgi:endonuclease III-like uncharacterized protein